MPVVAYRKSSSLESAAHTEYTPSLTHPPSYEPGSKRLETFTRSSCRTASQSSTKPRLVSRTRKTPPPDSTEDSVWVRAETKGPTVWPLISRWYVRILDPRGEHSPHAFPPWLPFPPRVAGVRPSPAPGSSQDRNFPLTSQLQDPHK